MAGSREEDRAVDGVHPAFNMAVGVTCPIVSL